MFFNRLFKWFFFRVIVSLTTEERKFFAAGFAALKTNGNTLLAMNENIPPPLLFLEYWENDLG